MGNLVKFETEDMPSGLSEVYFRITDTSEQRNDLFKGKFPVSGELIEIDIGASGSDGQGVIVYGDNYSTGNEASFKSFCGYGTITSEVIPIQPLRVVEQQGGYARTEKDFSGTYDKAVFEEEHYVGGGDVSEISFGFDVARLSAGVGGVMPSIGQDLFIEKCAIEINGVVVPLTFGGSRSVTIPAGSFNYQSDSILPAAFGLSNIAYDTTVKIRTIVNQGITTNKLGISNKDPRSCGGKCIWLLSSVCTISDIDLAGTYTVTGATQTVRNEMLSTRMLGKFTSEDCTVLVARGDSISQGTGDDSTQSRGPGWVYRAVQLFTKKPACLNLASHGSQADDGVLDARVTALYSLCTDGVVSYGANDIGTSGTGITAAGLLSRVNLIRQQMVDSGILTVGAMKLLPRTTSTDLWATEANQTIISAGWASGGVASEYNSLIESSSFNYVLDMNNTRGVDVYKWASNGTARYTSYDGTHPSSSGFALMASESKTDLIANISNLS